VCRLGTENPYSLARNLLKSRHHCKVHRTAHGPLQGNTGKRLKGDNMNLKQKMLLGPTITLVLIIALFVIINGLYKIVDEKVVFL
jgi:hypothetical protein